MRAVLCASLCNCRHSLRADDDEGLVKVVLEHMSHDHPYASLEEKRVRTIIRERSYSIDYVVNYSGSTAPRGRSPSSPIEQPQKI
jgi:predicted small metal-binding protein